MTFWEKIATDSQNGFTQNTKNKYLFIICESVARFLQLYKNGID